MFDSPTRSLRRSLVVLVAALCAALASGSGAEASREFRVVAFHADKVEEAHLSFVRGANRWFREMARQDGFSY